MGKLLPSGDYNSRAHGAPTPIPFPPQTPASSDKLSRRFYALARNANAATEGELAVLVAAAEDSQVESVYFIAAVTWGLETVGLPVKFRGYIDFLIELAAEDTESRSINDWFAVADVTVGARARLEPVPPTPPSNPTPESGARYKAALEKWKRAHCPTCPETGEILPPAQKDGTLRTWAARQRKKLVAWQQISNVTLIQVEEGDWDYETKKNRTTRYKLVFLEQVAEVLKLAKASGLWRRDPLEAIKTEARAVFRVTPDAPSLKSRRRGSKPDAQERLKRRRKAILSLLKGCREDLRELAKRDGAPAEDEWLASLTEEARDIFTGDLFGLSVEVSHVKQGGLQKCSPLPRSDEKHGGEHVSR